MVLVPLLFGVVLGGAPEAHGCELIVRNLERSVQRFRDNPRSLSSPPSYRQSGNRPGCKLPANSRALLEGESAPKGFHVGMLNERPAVAHLDGPGGSGRYWLVSLAVQTGKELLGTCFDTSTVAWRNLYPVAEDVGPWQPFTEDGRFVLWLSVQGDPRGSTATFVLAPLVFRLDKNELVPDISGTKAQLVRLAKIYAKSASSQSKFRDLHQNAAEAYHAWAHGKPCPSVAGD